MTNKIIGRFAPVLSLCALAVLAVPARAAEP